MKIMKNIRLFVALLSLLVLAGCGFHNKKKEDEGSRSKRQETPSEPLKDGEKEQPRGPSCPEGHKWDPASRTCVSVSKVTCAAGETLDPASGTCVASKLTCSAGETWDPVSSSCVPIPASSCPAAQRLVAGRGCVPVNALLSNVKSKISDPAFAQTSAFSLMKKHALKKLIQDFVLHNEVGFRKSAEEILNGKGAKGGIRQKLGLANLDLVGMRLTPRKHKAFVEQFKKDYLENSVFIRNMRDKCFDDAPNHDFDACLAEGIVVLDQIAAVQ